MGWILLALAVLGVLVTAPFVIGWMLPAAHVAERMRLLPRPPRAVWDLITDVARASQWRKDVQRVELLDAAGGARRWRELGNSGSLTLVEELAEPPRRWITRIDDPALPFGGRWIFSLDAEGSGTRLTIREEGEVYNPLFRFVSRFVMGHHATLDAYLRQLASHLAE